MKRLILTLLLLFSLAFAQYDKEMDKAFHFKNEVVFRTSEDGRAFYLHQSNPARYYKITVYDSHGKIVYEHRHSPECEYLRNFSMPLHSKPPGEYWVILCWRRPDWGKMRYAGCKFKIYDTTE